MPKQKYFTQRLSASERKLLHENPDAFSKKYQDKLTKIVYDDMKLLSTFVMPVYTITRYSNPYETNEDHHYWYHIKQDETKNAMDILNAYYGPRNPNLDVWEKCNKITVAELKKDMNIYKLDDFVFKCLRAIYFYNNYNNKKNWHMPLRSAESLYSDGFVDVYDFIDFDNKDDEKMLYSKKHLAKMIDEFCGKIVDSRIEAEKQRVMQIRQEIADAYAVLRKHGLLPENAMKSTQKQRS